MVDVLFGVFSVILRFRVESGSASDGRARGVWHESEAQEMNPRLGTITTYWEAPRDETAATRTMRSRCHILPTQSRNDAAAMFVTVRV